MNRGNPSLENMKTSLKDEFCVWSDAGKASDEYEISEEYILPDYLPDIRKLLLIKAKIEENDAFIEEGKAEYGGDVVFNVVYLGDTGQVKCVTQSYPYTNIISLESIYDDSIINSRTTVRNRSVRAVSPRKLLLKAKAVTDITVRNKLCVSPRLTGSTGVEDEFTLERKTDLIDSVNFIQFNESDIRVSEDVEYKGKNPISELIYYDADVFTTDCKYNDGRMYLKGNARVCCLVACNAGGEDTDYELIEKNIPIEHTSEVRLPINNSDCFAILELGAFECGVANDSYGESRVLEIDFACRANITAVANEKTMFTDDVFSTAYKYANTYKKVDTEKLIKCACANFSADGNSEIPKAEGTDFDRVVMSLAEADMALSEITNGKMVFSGDCNVKAVVLDKNNGYITSDFSFPIRFEMSCDNIEKYRYMCRCNVLDSRVTLDGSKINANVEIGLNFAMFEEVSANTVSQISIDKSSPLNTEKEKVMILYYPEGNEDLWSVAKKYGVSRGALEDANNKSLSEGLPRVIVIPTQVK